MSTEPVTRLAMLRMISASADIEAQLMNNQGTRPIVIMLSRARTEAAVALAQLATVARADAANIDVIRSLQDTVTRYDDLVRWLREIVASGFDCDQEITHEEREEMIEMLTRTPEGQEEAQELGLIERTDHAYTD